MNEFIVSPDGNSLTSVLLDTALLESLGIFIESVDADVVAPGALGDASVAFPIVASSDFTFSFDTTDGLTPLSGEIEHIGELTFADAETEPQATSPVAGLTVGDFAISVDSERATGNASGFFVADTVLDLDTDGAADVVPLFDIALDGGPNSNPAATVALADDAALQIAGADLLVSPELAGLLGDENLAGADVGDAQIETTVTPADDGTPADPSFTLQLLHASDLEGGIDAIERAPNFTAIANAFQDALPDNTLTLSAGDNYLSGPFFSAAGDTSSDAGIEAALGLVYEFLYELEPGTLFGEEAPNEIETDSGRVDIAIANLIGFDASVLGNHEFDLGTFEVADIIGVEVAGGFNDEEGILGELENPGTLFPYLAANLDFSGDSNLPFLFTDELLNVEDFVLDLEAIAELDAAVAAAGDEEVLRPNPDEGNDDFIDFDKIAPSVIADIAGEQVGIIGLTTPDLASLTSTGGVEVIGPDGAPSDPAVLQSLADIANEQVALLEAQGIDKIVVASHLQQFSFEQALAPLVSGVDIFLAGGSDFILLDENDPPFGADEAGDTYPVLTNNADGDPAVLLSTNGEFSYVGRLVVDFDENGVIIPESIDSIESGAFRTTDQGVLDAIELVEVAPEAAGITNFDDLDLEAIEGDAANFIGSIDYGIETEAGLVQNLTGAVEAVVEAQDGNIAGFTDVFLDGIRANVRTQETNLGNLSADANLFYAQQIDPEVTVSLQNAGGIRIQIGDLVNEAGSGESEFLPPQANEFRPEGAVSQLAISDVFRFDNSLTLQTITQADLVVQLENGVENAVASLDNEPGQFPQIAGVAFSFDPELPAFDPEAPEGTGRVLSAALVDDEGNPTTVLVENGEFVGDAEAPVRVVINEFLAGFTSDGINEPDGYTFEQLAADDPEFADVINLEEIDAPANFNEIEFAGATVNGQVDAVAEFLNAFHPTPETAFDVPETPVEEDLRIQNLAFRADTVLGDAAVGDDDREQIIGTAGDDTLLGGTDIDGIADNILVGAGNDTVDLPLAPGAGDNIVLGGSGSDTLVASSNDILSGGSGNDTFVLDENAIGSRISGGEGDDAFVISGGDSNRVLGGEGDDTFTIAGGTNLVISGGAGADLFSLGAPGEVAPTVAIADFDLDADSLATPGIEFAALSFAGSDILSGDDVLATLLGVDATALTEANFAG